MQQTGGANEVLRLGYVALKRLHCPLPCALIPRAIVHPGVKDGILAEVKRLVQMCHVLSKFPVIREAFLEVPVTISLGNVELVERCLGIDSGSGIL